VSRIGQRLGASTGADAPRYIKHPPAASQPWSNGEFVDAGFAHIVDNNLSHLSHESCRHLAWAPGPGTLEYTPALLAAGWRDLEDAPQVDYGPRAAPLVGISWDRRTAVRLGPFVGIQDRTTSDGLSGLRRVRVVVDCLAATPSGANGLYLYAALTADPAPPSEGSLVTGVGAGTVAAPSPVTIVGNRGRVSINLAVNDELGPTTQLRCRGDSSPRGRRVVAVTAYWLWVGWRASLANCAVIALSAFEYRTTL
jgi:hypothetical protein